jgi:hypothetical protein
MGVHSGFEINLEKTNCSRTPAILPLAAEVIEHQNKIYRRGAENYQNILCVSAVQIG